MRVAWILVWTLLLRRPAGSVELSMDAAVATTMGIEEEISHLCNLGLLGVYKECFRRWKLTEMPNMPWYHFFPMVNVMYELFMDEPIELATLQNILTYSALIVALLLNVVLTVPLSFSYDELASINEKFESNYALHNTFVKKVTMAHKASGNPFDMEGYHGMFSNWLGFFFSLATATLSTALLLIVMIFVTCNDRTFVKADTDGPRNHHSIAYSQWWRRCGRYLLFLQVGWVITGIYMSYLLFFQVLDFKFPNYAFENDLFGGNRGALNDLTDISKYNQSVCVLMLWFNIGFALTFISYGTTHRFLLKHACGSKQLHLMY